MTDLLLFYSKEIVYNAGFKLRAAESVKPARLDFLHVSF